jgi:hypothetical protein
MVRDGTCATFPSRRQVEATLCHQASSPHLSESDYKRARFAETRTRSPKASVRDRSRGRLCLCEKTPIGVTGMLALGEVLV